MGRNVAKRQAWNKVYNATSKARARRAAYEKSDNCVAYRNSYAEMYEAKPERIAAKKEYRKSAKGKYLIAKSVRAYELRKYGVTEVQYQRMLRRQNGVCAICKAHPNGASLCVDHCHATGKLRGLLCHACNIGISKFDDDPNVVRMAAGYLEVYH
jgi:hypothetical protein